MKKIYLFSLVVLTLMLAACTSDESAQQSKVEPLPFCAVITSETAVTRGLTEAADGKTIKAAWEVGEKMALVHGATVDVMTVKSVDESGNATIEGLINNFTEGGTVYLVYIGHNPEAIVDYPGSLSLALENASATEYTPAIIAQTFGVLGQNGTLTTISSEYDYRLGQSTLTKSSGTVTLASSTTLASQFAIWKFSLTTDGTTALAATKLDITDGSDNLITSVTPAAAASTFYVLLPAATNATYKFKATAESGNYYCTHSGITLAAANFYHSTLIVSKLPGSISFEESSMIKNHSDLKFNNTLSIVGDGSVSYSSSNINVATVEADGDVTIVGSGTTTITATVTDSEDYTYATNTAQYTLTVYVDFTGTWMAPLTEFEAKDGAILTGTLDTGNYPLKISVADGATITLKDVNISGTDVDDDAHKHAGITCLGDATIILSGTNTVRGFHKKYPGMIVAENKTLTIKGDGSLNAIGSGSFGAGIGSGYNVLYGNIEIQGGTITATGGSRAAGIGSGGSDNGGSSRCGNITISGGTVTAQGGSSTGAGIGCGQYAGCGNITITNGVTKVTAKSNGTYSIGPDGSAYGSCGTVTIGCTLDGNGNPVGGTVYLQNYSFLNDGATYLATKPLIYEP